VDVGQHTTVGDGNVVEKLVQLLVVSDGQLNVSRDNPVLAVISGGVTSQLENLGGEVLKDRGEIHRGTSSDTLCVTSLTEMSVDTTDGELKSGLGRTGVGGLSGLLSGLASGRLALGGLDAGG